MEGDGNWRKYCGKNAKMPVSVIHFLKLRASLFHPPVSFP